jgi:hypothetical protein
MGEILFPDPTKWYVKIFRFMNILDDAHNILSPVKMNVWAANLGAVSTMVATVFSYMSGHIVGIESLWAGSVGWLTHAHTMHHLDKGQRSKTKIEMTKIDKNDPSNNTIKVV